jgi:glycosyltransferase involved in cell wall biosynthesis
VTQKPRVLFVGRTRYRLPLPPATARKFDALAHELDVHVLASAAPGSGTAENGTFRLVPQRPLDGPRFWLELPWRTARALRELRPDAVVAQTAYEAAAALLARRLTGSRAKVVLEVHADWRASTRLYGSPARRLLSRFGDAVAASAVRRSDAVRTVSPFTTDLVRELGVAPAGTFPAFMELDAFTARPPAPLPAQPRLLFVGVLERYKGFDALVDAWRLAAPRVPDAMLHVVGSGSLRELVPTTVQWSSRLEPEEVAAAMDEAWALVLPSRSEGMGRVLVEAFCRGRGVVGTRAGSIPDLVEDGRSGILVDPDDPRALADAIVRVLSDRGLAERLGAAAHESAGAWLQTPEEYAARMRALVE